MLAAVVQLERILSHVVTASTFVWHNTLAYTTLWARCLCNIQVVLHSCPFTEAHKVLLTLIS